MTPYREGKPLDQIIAPDRRRRRAIALIVTSMMAGAGLWTLGGALVERVSLAATGTPSVSADARVAQVIAAKQSGATRTTVRGLRASLLEEARQAAIEGRADEVRRLLEWKVRFGHGTEDEARLVRAACAMERDSSCIHDVDAKYPRPGQPSAVF